MYISGMRIVLAYCTGTYYSWNNYINDNSSKIDKTSRYIQINTLLDLFVITFDNKIYSVIDLNYDFINTICTSKKNKTRIDDFVRMQKMQSFKSDLFSYLTKDPHNSVYYLYE